MLTFSTTTRPRSGSTRTTVPRLPESLPAITCTESPFLILIFASATGLQHLWRERDDLHEVALAQLTRNRAEDTGPAGVALVVDDHCGVLVEGDVGAVLAVMLLLGAHHHGRHHLALLDAAVRGRLLDGADDDVADPGIAALAAALDTDAEQLAGAGVVRHAKPGLHQPHDVTGLGAAGLVMGMQADRPAHHLLVLGVRLEDVDAHDHRLVHLVGHDDAAALLAPAPLFGCGLVLAHDACTFWAAARSWESVSSRAMSRLARCSAAGFSSAPVACWNRRLNSSWRASPMRRSSSSSVSSRISLALKEITLPRHELGPDRELHGSQPDRLTCQRLGHAGQLEHDTAGFDHGHPVLGRALAGAHARLGRLGRDGLVRADVAPDLAAALDLAGHRDTGGLDLPVGDPALLHRLQPVLAELHAGAALGQAGAASAMRLAVLGSLWQQHYASPPSGASGAASSAAGCSAFSAEGFSAAGFSAAGFSAAGFLAAGFFAAGFLAGAFLGAAGSAATSAA